MEIILSTGDLRIRAPREIHAKKAAMEAEARRLFFRSANKLMTEFERHFESECMEERELEIRSLFSDWLREMKETCRIDWRAEALSRG